MEIYMGIRIAVSNAAAGALAVAVAMAAGSGAAFAQANVLKECGSQYQAAKAANELGGQSWQEFLKACRARLAEQAKPAESKPAEAPPPAAESKPTPPPATEAKPAEPTPPPATEAKPVEPPAATTPPAKPDTKSTMREREKKCGAEWKSTSRELKKTNPKITWPKFWSECNKRLKAAGE
jgi:outer membrane biosynthesis protein TonB